MKNLLKPVFAVAFMILSSCGAFHPLIDATQREISYGIGSVIVNASLEKVKEAFINEGILFESMLGGLKTESIQIDRIYSNIKYKAVEFDGKVKIIALEPSYYVLEEFASQVKYLKNYPGGYFGQSLINIRDRARYILNRIADICEKNNLDYKFAQ